MVQSTAVKYDKH